MVVLPKDRGLESRNGRFLVTAPLIDLAADEIPLSIRRFKNQELANLYHGFVVAPLLIEVLYFVQRLLRTVGLGGVDRLPTPQIGEVYLIQNVPRTSRQILDCL